MRKRTNPAEPAVNILIVEDSPTQAEALRFVLEEKGYRVTLAGDGRQALDSLNGYEPALVISDIIMPEIGGFELCRRIKADERTRDIPVILLTALSDIENVIDGLVCGADGFISKPYSADYIVVHVEQALADKSSRPIPHAQIELEIPLAGKPRNITVDPRRMLSLLLSTYKAAISRNSELIQSHADLSSLNAHLEALVEERTAALTREIVERKHLQEELRELSLQDELTGLHNRRGFLTLAGHHIKLALRAHQYLTFFYLDLDDLKQINDTCGHLVGDQALVATAALIKKAFRETDIIARLGGDEFCVMAIDSDRESAGILITHLEEGVCAFNQTKDAPFRLSLSAGIAYFVPDKPASIEKLVAQADAEMYAQKAIKKVSRQ
jgi:diguanylate cyclase (GGDEF)-like protein